MSAIECAATLVTNINHAILMNALRRVKRRDYTLRMLVHTSAIVHAFHASLERARMYLVYSLLLVVFVLAGSPYFLYQAMRYKKYIGSLRQRLGYLPVSFNLDGEESIWIHAVSVGEVLTARAARRRAEGALSAACGSSSRRRRSPGSRWRGAACRRRRRLLFPVRLGVHRPPHARPREAAALRHDGDRDLAEPAARVPPARREDGGGQRPHLVAVVSALPADPAVLPPRARRRRSLLHAERGVGAPARSTSAPTRRASPSPAA